ncbi:phage holin family protein [Plantactinospora sonchi]|uniref:phage holin family protein n=1 Tax=Plantactinospora sonchi TaxID=1544735 RepID=UPI0038B65FFB
MKAHRTDGVSLTFALIFLAIAAWWLLARLMNLALPAVGWILALALIVVGALGLMGALRSSRSAPTAAEPAQRATVTGPAQQPTAAEPTQHLTVAEDYDRAADDTPTTELSRSGRIADGFDDTAEYHRTTGEDTIGDPDRPDPEDQRR